MSIVGISGDRASRQSTDTTSNTFLSGNRNKEYGSAIAVARNNGVASRYGQPLKPGVTIRESDISKKY